MLGLELGLVGLGLGLVGLGLWIGLGLWLVDLGNSDFRNSGPQSFCPVSYTHLTLPTILRV